MHALDEFIGLLAGRFDNAAQYEEMKQAGKADAPFARHVNTPCNGKIRNLPAGFGGVFLLEESYYTVNGSTHASPHLFCFTQQDDGILLTSYELPQGCDKAALTFDTLGQLEYSQLQPSKKFTPALYRCKNGVWEGGSVSMFSPVLKFTLFERFSPAGLEVSESMEMNGKRTFGYDEPIRYQRSPA